MATLRPAGWRARRSRRRPRRRGQSRMPRRRRSDPAAPPPRRSAPNEYVPCLITGVAVHTSSTACSGALQRPGKLAQGPLRGGSRRAKYSVGSAPPPPRPESARAPPRPRPLPPAAQPGGRGGRPRGPARARAARTPRVCRRSPVVPRYVWHGCPVRYRVWRLGTYGTAVARWWHG